MKSTSVLSVGLAIAFAFLSAASAAEDRPNTTLVQKSRSTAATPSAATKAVKAQAATPTSATSTVTTGAKQGAPMAAPTAEPAYEGCHGKGGDA